MRCWNCGKEIDMSKRRRDGSVRCPYCQVIYRQKADTQTRSPKKNITNKPADRLNSRHDEGEMNKTPRNTRRSSPWKKAVLAIIVLAVFGGVVFVALHQQNRISSMDDDGPRLESAESYYSKIGEVIAVTKADRSNTTTNESETITSLAQRGFDQYPLTSDYELNGQYIDSAEMQTGSTKRHPIYETYYVSSRGSIWTVYSINGCTMANPATFNINSGKKQQVLLSETPTLTSYDGNTNQFFQTIPNESEIKIIVVDQINADTLEYYSDEVLGGI